MAGRINRQGNAKASCVCRLIRAAKLGNTGSLAKPLRRTPLVGVLTASIK
ncbi:unnamed protein product [Schistosoma margrebowiei]|uniref:Uncharacterized protein n=1 Tax=Schistosoma margrebowiei TaxID=48269 RepID=A0A183LL75_9TREM|nr:unnamed protein product [Schistosoma margrebowiei]